MRAMFDAYPWMETVVAHGERLAVRTRELEANAALAALRPVLEAKGATRMKLAQD